MDDRQYHLKFDSSKGAAVDDYLEYRRFDILIIFINQFKEKNTCIKNVLIQFYSAYSNARDS